MSDNSSILRDAMQVIDEQQPPSNFAGFEYESEIDDETNRRSELLQEYHQKGFEPVAALPGTFFDELCAEFGLFRFENIDENGTTGSYLGGQRKQLWRGYLFMALIGAQALPEAFFQKRSGSISSLISTTGALAFFHRIIERSKQGDDGFEDWADFLTDPQAALSATTFFGGVLGSFGAEFYDSYPPPTEQPTDFAVSVLKKLGVSTYQLGINVGSKVGALHLIEDVFNEELAMKLMMKLLPKKQRFRCYWPEGVDCSRRRSSVDVKFDVSPSSTFARSLDRLKEQDKQPNVAAVPEAIQVDEEQAINEVADRQRQRRLDPILYQRHNDHVVVLAQDGEFAPEQQVMAWVQSVGVSLLD